MENSQDSPSLEDAKIEMEARKRRLKRWRMTIEYGPLLLFFISYFFGGFLWATAILMGASALGIAALYLLERRIPVMMVVTVTFVAVFGGLTLILQDERFFKMKPTIVQGLFALILFGGLIFKRPLLRPLLGQALSLTEVGWRRLSFNFGLFFVGMALLNELVWRTQSETFWVSFKVFGISIATVLFTFTQVPLLRKYHVESEASDKTEAEP